MAFNPLIGKDLQVYIDASTIAFADSFDYTLDKKTIDVTNLSSAGWDEFVLGSKSWDGNVSGLFVKTLDASRSFDYLLDNYLTTNASVGVMFKPSTTGYGYVQGSAFVTNLKVSNGGLNDKVTYSATLKGTGPLTKATS